MGVFFFVLKLFILQALVTQTVAQKWAFLCSSAIIHIHIVISTKVALIISYLLVNVGEILYR